MKRYSWSYRHYPVLESIVHYLNSPSKFSALLITVLTLSAQCAIAADWPQFQGPLRNGTSPETGLARSWPTDGPPLLWSMTLGKGYGGAAVRDGEVFLLDRISTQGDVLLCLSLETGQELWRYAYDAPGKVSYDGSRTVPTVTQSHVFIVGMMGQFHCIDRSTHKPVWKIDLLEEFRHGKKPHWGFSQSPSVYKDLVIIAPQTAPGSVVAFKQSTGEQVWTAGGLGGAGYSTPVVTRLGGVDQVVMTTPHKSSNGGLTGISADDGSILWRYREWKCNIPIPYPITLPDDMLFITGGYRAGSNLIQVLRGADGFSVREVFKWPKYGSHVQQPLFYDGHIFVNRGKASGMTCLSITGELMWRTKDQPDLPNFDRGSLLAADGMIISLDSKTGILHLVEASSQGYKELARAEMFEGAQMWSPMALSQGKLLLRSKTTLKCLDISAH